MSGSELSSCTCQWCQVQSHCNTTRSRVPKQPLGLVNSVLRAHMSWAWHKKVSPAHGALVSRIRETQTTVSSVYIRADGRSLARVAPKLLVLALGFRRKKCHQKCILVSLFRAAQQYCLLLRKFYVNDNRSSSSAALCIDFMMCHFAGISYSADKRHFTVCRVRHPDLSLH